VCFLSCPLSPPRRWIACAWPAGRWQGVTSTCAAAGPRWGGRFSVVCWRGPRGPRHHGATAAASLERNAADADVSQQLSARRSLRLHRPLALPAASTVPGSAPRRASSASRNASNLSSHARGAEPVWPDARAQRSSRRPSMGRGTAATIRRGWGYRAMQGCLVQLQAQARCRCRVIRIAAQRLPRT